LRLLAIGPAHLDRLNFVRAAPANGSGRRRCRGRSSSTWGRCWRAIRTTASGRPRTASSTAMMRRIRDPNRRVRP